ncbi:protein kinase domain-containing protein [Candidatus Uabimicrobium amorphum]|uniref:non-specific serine/threonine protein kinase n=1 Tax=Uabimicrobium amorphum TaxID=2596890 RepID=A0A5S9F4L5_UABAM|nr:protein kinase [Candidatus Uabimicrobium amorphum]BBM85925.1 protein kinase [Candidatus Uabimicrobium amorphum]
MQNQYLRHYQIIRKLGQGGMAIVYLARDTKINRYVAIKMMNDEQTSHERFVREAKYSASLHHPNIVKIYDFFVVQNIPCIVMEYVEGHTLKEYLNTHSLSVQQKVKIFDQILHAIHYAHQCKIIHRDLKPSNIMITKDGSLRIMDFGLAKKLSHNEKNLTKSQQVIGSLFYMSPEQVQAQKNMNHLVDIYALGAILYEMLTAQKVFDGPTPINIFYKIVHEKPRLPSKINPQVPSSLDAICINALQKNKNHRYQSADLFSHDIQAWLQGKSTRASSLKNFIAYYKNGLVVFLSILILTPIVFLVFTKQTVQIPSSQITFTLQNKIDQWIYNGLYEKAHEELLASKINAREYREYQLLIYAKSQRFSKFEILIKEQEKPFSTLVSMALGEYHFLKNNYEKAFPLLKTVATSAKSKGVHKKYSFYYLGRIYFQKQQYQLALENFRLCQEIRSKWPFLAHQMLQLFIGKNYFYLNKPTLAIESFQSVQSQLQHNAEIYFYTAKSYILLNDYKRAHRNLQKSIELDYENADYRISLGKLLVKQKKYKEAGDVFLQVRALHPLNTKALKEFTAIANKDINLLEERYLALLHDLENWRYVPTENIRHQLYSIRDQHKNDYYTLQRLLSIQTHRKSILHLVDKMSSKNKSVSHAARLGILTMRHTPQVLQILQQKKYHKIAQDVKKMAIRERYSATCYVMAQACLYPYSNIIDELDVKNVEKILCDRQVDIWHRYIAARSLLLLYQFEKVELFRRKNEDQNLQIVCSRALQDFDIVTVRKPQTIAFASHDPNIVMIAAGARSFFKIDMSKLPPSLLDNTTVAMEIAMNLKKKYAAPAARIFAKYTDEKYPPHIRKIAFHYLGRIIGRAKPLQKQYAGLWLKALQQLEKLPQELQITILQKLPSILDVPEGTMKNILYTAHHPYVKIAAIDRMLLENTSDGILRKYYRDEKNNPIVRLYIFYKIFRKGMIKLRLENPEFLIKSQNNFLRSYGYSMYAACGGEVLDWLEKEQYSNIQALILKNVGMMTLPIARDRRKPVDQRMAILKRYFSAKNTNLRTYAYGGYAFLANLQQLNELIEQVRGKDFYARKGISLAINRRIEMELLEKSGALKLISVFQGSRVVGEVPFLDEFYKNIKDKNYRRRYKAWFLKINKLKYVDVDDIFRQAMVAKEDGNYERAIKLMQQATALEQKVIFYVELADLYWKHTKKIPSNIINTLQKLTRAKVIVASSYSLLSQIPHPQIDKVLKQSILSLTPYGKERKKAWRNMMLYYKKRGKKSLLVPGE